MVKPSNDNPRVFIPPPFVFGGALTAGLFIDSSALRYGLTQCLGLLLLLTGVGLIVAALGLFRTSKTRQEPWQPASALVRGGIYRITRNPMYLGMGLAALGVALTFSSLAGSVLTFVAVVVIDRVVIKREEAYLTRRFGRDYTDYTRSVRRWL